MRLLLLLATLLSTAAAAQPALHFVVPADGPALSIDVLHALGDDIPVTSAIDPNPTGDEIAVTSLAVIVGGRAPVGGVTLVGEVPLGYVAYDAPETGLGGLTLEDESGLALGNPYVGAEFRPTPGAVVSGGLRLPLVRSAAQPRDDSGGRDAPGDESSGRSDGRLGGLTAEAERFEAYAMNTLTASAGVAVTAPVGERLRLLARLDPALLVPTGGDGAAKEVDLLVGAGVGAEARLGRAVLHAGLFGRRVLTDGRIGSTELFDTDGLLTAGVAFEVGGVRPGLEVRIPFAEPAYGADAAIRLRLGVPLR